MRLNVQADNVGKVVRVVLGEDSAELTPEEAKEAAEELRLAAQRVDTQQATLPTADDQQQLIQSSQPDDGEFSEMLEDDDDWEIGDVLNENNPLDW